MKNTDIAIIVPADHNVATVKPFTVGESYQMLQDAVGGWFECVHVGHGIDMWVNENGIAEELPMNALATTLYWNTHRELVMNAFIFGDVILTSTDGMGETVGLTLDQFNYVGPMLDDFEIKLDVSLLA